VSWCDLRCHLLLAIARQSKQTVLVTRMVGKQEVVQYWRIADSCSCCRWLENWGYLCCLGTTTIILRPFVRDYPGEPVPEGTFTHPPSWSSSNLYQLLPSTTIHNILPVQIACLAIFLHNLAMSFMVYLLVWSPAPHSIPFFTQWVSSFRNTCPYHRNLFCCSISHLFLVFLSTPDEKAQMDV